MKTYLLLLLLLLSGQASYCWGFYGHQKINEQAIFLLPPKMLLFFKKNRDYLITHAVDPDKRRYAVPEEGPRHFIDLDYYGVYPFSELPRTWKDAADKYCADTLQQHGIVPWWIQTMLGRLTRAFEQKDAKAILKNAAEIGHYLSDAHVPLHTSSNHNGQKTNQHGIHGFWESRIPELFANKEWDFWIGKADYIPNPLSFTWSRVLESEHAVDTVLGFEKELKKQFPTDQQYNFEERNGLMIKQYATAYATAYNNRMQGMVERRMREAIYAVASFWFTAWVNAGQPDLELLTTPLFDLQDQKDLDSLNRQWQAQKLFGKSCE